ncbi:MAG: HNH endonuclease, partial [bacterium]
AFRCAICGLKMLTPDQLNWEVQAAHIVPHSVFGRDDIWNGLALCHLHHWCFDAGWITLDEQYRIQVSPKVVVLPKNYGKIEDFELIRTLASENRQINLPSKSEFYPHSNSIRWHRQNIFYSC